MSKDKINADELSKKLGLIDNFMVYSIVNEGMFIKKSIDDGGLAIFDEKKDAIKQLKSISDANHEKCNIIDTYLINREKMENYKSCIDSLIEENKQLREAIEQTIGWNEATGGRVEDIRLLLDVLSELGDE